MMKSIIAAAGLAATPLLASTNPFVHSVEVSHAGKPAHVTYSGRIDVETRQIGHSVPNRQDTTRCLWNASLAVTREVRAAPAAPGLSQALPAAASIDGNRPGACAPQMRSIDREVASRQDELRARLIEVAEDDRPALMNDLGAAATLARP